MDVAIVGNGPAGWSCAMTARMRGLSTVVIAPTGAGGWLSGAERIDNYPGLPQVSGKELLERFRQQALALGAEEKSALVRQIMPNGERFLLLAENDVLEAKAVVLCMGAARPVLLPGEEELLGSGISYCATCDGMFYRGKRVAVLSASASGVEEAAFLRSLAGSVDYYALKPHDVSSLPEGVQAVAEKPRSLAWEQGKVALSTDRETHLYDGVFIFRTAVPLRMLLDGLETDGGAIRVDRSMRASLPGVFAAGDVTGGPLQIAKAVADGAIAGLNISEFLRNAPQKEDAQA